MGNLYWRSLHIVVTKTLTRSSIGAGVAGNNENEEIWSFFSQRWIMISKLH